MSKIRVPPCRNLKIQISSQNPFSPGTLKSEFSPRQNPLKNPDFSQKFWGEMTLWPTLAVNEILGNYFEMRSVWTGILKFFNWLHLLWHALRLYKSRKIFVINTILKCQIKGDSLLTFGLLCVLIFVKISQCIYETGGAQSDSWLVWQGNIPT